MGFGVRGLGFGAWGLVFRVWGFVSRVWGLGFSWFRGSGLGFDQQRVGAKGFRGVGFRVLGSGARVRPATLTENPEHDTLALSEVSGFGVRRFDQRRVAVMIWVF